MKRRFAIGVVAWFPSGGASTLKFRPGVSSFCHCLVTVLSVGRAQRYLSLTPHPGRLGYGGIQGPEGTGVSVGRSVNRSGKTVGSRRPPEKTGRGVIRNASRLIYCNDVNK